jgi:hypothetical protein
MIETPLLAMAISNLLYQALGFGPSKSVCEPFAEAVKAEAELLGIDLGGPRAGPGALPIPEAVDGQG